MPAVQSINKGEISYEDAADPFDRVDTSHLQKFVEIRGVNINYVKVGHGPHGVLLLNGSVGHIDSDYGPIISKFSTDKFTVVAWDYPGCGKSRPPNRDFTSKCTFLHSDADFGYELMNKLGFAKFSVLGWCAGGIVAVILAAKYPESVQRLIISGSRSHFTEEELNVYKGLRDVSSWAPHAKAALLNGYEGEEDYIIKCWSDLNDFYVNNFNTNDGKLCQDELSLVKCPALIIHGEIDPIVPIHHAHFNQEKIPNSELILMPNGKHNLHLKYTDEFLRYVEEFLQRKSI